MHARTLGRCPVCGAAIPNRRKLIEYETEAGWLTMFAECPECLDVVRPR